MKLSKISLFCLSAITLAVASASHASPTPPAGLPNFGAVDPGIYRGAAPTDAGLQTLKKMGVQTVIDLRISPKLVKKESAEVKQLGMTFVNLPMGADPPTAKETQTFLALAGQAGLHPIYVHCQYGADRTGVMVGLYRRTNDHWSYDRTYAEMRHYGFKPWYTKLAALVKDAGMG
jgi:tyrosine-protein phosphatase SIW14